VRERLYRIDLYGIPRFAAERDGRLCLIDGDVFGEFALGEEVARGRVPNELPAGVGPLAAGDVVEVRVEGVGELSNLVQGERSPA